VKARLEKLALQLEGTTAGAKTPAMRPKKSNTNTGSTITSIGGVDTLPSTTLPSIDGMNTIVSSTSLTISPKDGAVSIIDIGGLEQQQLEQQQQQQQQQHFEPTGQLLSKLKTKSLDINLSCNYLTAGDLFSLIQKP
jgi:hypothetical protein